ncbi:hypothetical protein O6H91_Y375900 [Diphasiastrum complanatum]|nr:hypothetical protein O6H91_Y375900 [Diphasiastrum complanatum]
MVMPLLNKHIGSHKNPKGFTQSPRHDSRFHGRFGSRWLFSSLQHLQRPHFRGRRNEIQDHASTMVQAQFAPSLGSNRPATNALHKSEQFASCHRVHQPQLNSIRSSILRTSLLQQVKGGAPLQLPSLRYQHIIHCRL